MRARVRARVRARACVSGTTSHVGEVFLNILTYDVVD